MKAYIKAYPDLSLAEIDARLINGSVVQFQPTLIGWYASYYPQGCSCGKCPLIMCSLAEESANRMTIWEAYYACETVKNQG